MIEILKASAGSGKTYALAREYLRLILSSDMADAYRHVLAVTFTNKATDEMKQRILRQLYILAKVPEESPYYQDFVSTGVAGSPSALQKKAQQQLSGILNDYSAFAVSTIDRFFQQTLRAFSREIGQFSTYQVQLDREALVAESVDRLLDSLSEEKDSQLLGWIVSGAKEDLLSTGKFSLEGRLKEVAGSLKDLPDGKADYSREELRALSLQCKKIAESFLERVQTCAEEALAVLKTCGVAPEDSNRGFLKNLYDYRQPSHPVPRPKDSFLQKAPDPSQWFSKAKASLMERLGGALDAPLEAFLACFDLPFKEYNTARTIQAQLYSLGVAGELRETFSEIQKEKNILSIDDSNAILRHIIDGTDTPFIYEKLGVRFEDFLLDEFQDTALIQWENFRPLLHESDSSGHSSLVVGDAKQSIYRWRGSDWSLLSSAVEKEFQQPRVQVLDGNYRTCRTIVHFNNDFFAFAAAQLDTLTQADGLITGLYEDLEQKVRFKESAPGSVEVTFSEDQKQEILQTLAALHESGAHWADIAVLVRGNAEGAAVAAALVENRIPVVSDDSLFVKASVTVRRLVAQLSLQEQYHSLVDLSEQVLRSLHEEDPVRFEAEIPYIQSFMDFLQDWVQLNGNSLDAFLRQWEGAQPKIASPEAGDSVRVMTIHKSKGLEFPFVIVPYAEKVTLYKASSYWCAPDAAGSALEPESENLFRVSLDGKVADTFFAEDYRRERVLQAVDNLNIFYVALTRAKYGLKIIAAPPSKNILEGKSEEWKNLSQLLYRYVGGLQYYVGEPFQWAALKREKSAIEVLPGAYPSYPALSGDRLRFSPEAADYFGEDGSFGPAASHRIRGNVLHGILERTVHAEDLPSAVEAAVRDGSLPAAEAAGTLEFLQERLASQSSRGWFSQAAQHRLEAAIIGGDGQEYRPDRVSLFEDGSVDIVDYKFGKPEESYTYQVRRYMRLYRAMGYARVRGYLWYVFPNEISEIKL